MPSSHLTFILWLIGNTILSAILVKIIARIGIMDTPNQRSSHQVPIPKGGGIGIMTAFLTGSISIFYLFHQHFSLSILCILSATLFLSIFSWLDDLKQWPALLKLAIQSLVAITLCFFLLPISLLEQTSFVLFPVIFIWLVYLTNVFNFMDGLNGLAAGVAAISCIFFYYHNPDLGSALLALSLLTGLIGFLPFNYPKAEIFMGDVGSQACGLLLAIFAVLPLGNEKSLFHHFPLPMDTILIFYLLFGMIYDVTFTLIRRIINKDSFLQAHRSHLYQMAHRSHMPDYLITCIHWGFCIWGGLLIFFLPLTSFFTISLSFSLLFLPQLLWTFYIYDRTRKMNIKKW